MVKEPLSEKELELLAAFTAAAATRNRIGILKEEFLSVANALVKKGYLMPEDTYGLYKLKE
jgi:hypothetical protein